MTALLFLLQVCCSCGANKDENNNKIDCETEASCKECQFGTCVHSVREVNWVSLVLGCCACTFDVN